MIFLFYFSVDCRFYLWNHWEKFTTWVSVISMMVNCISQYFLYSYGKTVFAYIIWIPCEPMSSLYNWVMSFCVTEMNRKVNITFLFFCSSILFVPFEMYTLYFIILLSLGIFIFEGTYWMSCKKFYHVFSFLFFNIFLAHPIQANAFIMLLPRIIRLILQISSCVLEQLCRTTSVHI